MAASITGSSSFLGLVFGEFLNPKGSRFQEFQKPDAFQVRGFTGDEALQTTCLSGIKPGVVAMLLLERQGRAALVAYQFD